MEKINAGLISIALLIILQGVGWYFGKDGMLTATVTGLIGLIAGSIFGFSFSYAKKENQKE